MSRSNRRKASERRKPRADRGKQGLKVFLSAIEQGDLDVEHLSVSERTKLAKLIEQMRRRDKAHEQ